MRRMAFTFGWGLGLALVALTAPVWAAGDHLPIAEQLGAQVIRAPLAAGDPAADRQAGVATCLPREAHHEPLSTGESLTAGKKENPR